MRATNGDEQIKIKIKIRIKIRIKITRRSHQQNCHAPLDRQSCAAVVPSGILQSNEKDRQEKEQTARGGGGRRSRGDGQGV